MYTASVTPNSLGFGNETVGTTSATQNLTVKNTGNSALGGMNITGGGVGTLTRVTNGGFPQRPQLRRDVGGRRFVHGQGGLRTDGGRVGIRNPHHWRTALLIPRLCRRR